VAFWFVAPAAGACTASSASDHPHLVELYSSEGCSSCPPAERWMSSLLKRPDIVGLQFHVDYWDDAAWRDPYSQHAFTERQEALARRDHGNQIYTPQILIDGHNWQGWGTQDIPAVAATGSPMLELQADAASDGTHVQLNATATGTDAARDYKLFVALTENDLVQDVRGGENRGIRMHHDQVVRAFAGPLGFPRAQTTLHSPAGLDRAHSTLVAFVQDQHDGSIVQVVSQPLNTCTK
jgi:hypothetical protein